MAEHIIFYILSAIIVVFSVMAVTSKRLIRSATYLLFVLLAIAGWYLILDYEYLFAVQTAVYAGGIMVLYVFSILLTSGKSDNVERIKNSKMFAVLAAVLGGAAILLFIYSKYQFLQVGDNKVAEVTIQSLGTNLMSSNKYGYLLPFEAISVFLLACIVGGIVIARIEEDKK